MWSGPNSEQVQKFLEENQSRLPVETRDPIELKKLPNQFCIGEMLDWDAPTGGYLLQGCASTGVYLAEYLNKKSIKAC